MNKRLVLVVACAVLITGVARGAETLPPRLTHANAALIVARHAGYFDRHIKKNADLNECVDLLNQNGIYFGLLEIVTGEVFTEKDCARVLGQIDLLLNGEAARVTRETKLPSGVDSWEEYCTLNAIDFKGIWQAMLKMVCSLENE